LTEGKSIHFEVLGLRGDISVEGKNDGVIENSLSLEPRILIGVHCVKHCQIDIWLQISHCHSQYLKGGIHSQNIFETTLMFSKI
jgi:hypothetical protein